ncbi:hypothetical protein HDU86_002277 [Geranomyces michiganensis]|nr:hypothetical protein HDU86_002277 [Geranomyces michiganensis]
MSSRVSAPPVLPSVTNQAWTMDSTSDTTTTNTSPHEHHEVYATSSGWTVRPTPPASPPADAPPSVFATTSSLSPMDVDYPPPPPQPDLSAILDDEAELAEVFSASSDSEADPSSSPSARGKKSRAPQGCCVECEDQPADLFCEQCADDFCEVCFFSLHRKGSRKKHTTTKLVTANGASRKEAKAVRATGVSASAPTSTEADDEAAAAAALVDFKLLGEKPGAREAVGSWFLERAKYTPLRLTLEERKFLRLLEAALGVSEYTDKIDILSYGSKSKRIVAQIKELCAILSGLVLAADYKIGQELFQDRDFSNNAEFFQEIFEFGRRHKIMNPEKMRTSYGKLMYMLQDSMIPEVKELLAFACVKPIRTVYTVLAENGGLGVLEDPLISPATQEVLSEGRTRHSVQAEIKLKERAIEQLARKYATSKLKGDTIRQCLYSIGDNHAFLRVNRDPCDKMIAYLQRYFKPDSEERGFSLAIRSGRSGARLSHDHSKQYAYVLQSLTLWREIMQDMFHVWMLAEQDLLSDTCAYRLRDTGQGLNRVQAAPKTSRMMHTILHRASQKVPAVGSQVIHLGDNAVPNALTFIDKYTQVYRILLPICTTLSRLPDIIANDAGIAKYIKTEFGDIECLIKTILADFFRSAFDGSGADNFFDAGSCIDGRLTSAWNWTAQIEKKPFFPVFLLTGFVGFDGAW